MKQNVLKATNVFSPNLLGAHRYTIFDGIVRSPRGLADGIAHIKHGQQGKIHFPYGTKNVPTLLCNLRAVLPRKDVAILI